MFKPNSRIRKMFANCSWSDTAYIYPDGIVLHTEKSMGAKRVEVNHVFPCSIKMNKVSDYLREDGRRLNRWKKAWPYNEGEGDQIHRLIVSNPTMLADGVAEVEVNFGVTTDISERQGVVFTEVVIVTPSGGRHVIRTASLNGSLLLSAEVTIQPDIDNPSPSWLEAPRVAGTIHDFVGNWYYDLKGKRHSTIPSGCYEKAA